MGVTLATVASPPRGQWLRHFGQRHERALFLVAGALIALAIAAAWLGTRPAPRELTQKDIDAAVLHTLETAQMPSRREQGLRGHTAVGGAGDRTGRRTGPRRRQQPQLARRLRHRHRRGHRRQGHHPDQPARRRRRRTSESGVFRRPGVGRHGHRHAAGARSRRAAGQDHSGRSRCRHVALDRRPRGRRRGGGGGLSVRHRSVGVVGHRVGPAARISVAGRQAAADQPDPVRRGGQSRQLRAARWSRQDGEVVGIVTAILNPTEQRVFIGIGFAVPIENAAAAVGMSPF